MQRVPLNLAWLWTRRCLEIKIFFLFICYLCVKPRRVLLPALLELRQLLCEYPRHVPVAVRAGAPLSPSAPDAVNRAEEDGGAERHSFPE